MNYATVLITVLITVSIMVRQETEFGRVLYVEYTALTVN